ncbi:uncharacterized protein LOC119066358 [Bradysia coprophila]|uniref:uncharacterized protein LOC119066358 n=1 Tax=Bradysia coprophila TaxID=38358 RepID=UPI00187D750F|nr:uncharacterized protein LOC119066358 [Bradysia coprophila]
MCTTQVTSTNSLVKAIDDVDGILAAILTQSSSKWKSAKKSKKGDKMPTKLRFIGDSFWTTVKEMRATVTDSVEKSIRRSSMLLLKHVRKYRDCNTMNCTIDKIEAATSIVSKTTDGAEVCDNFYEALHLACVKYKMMSPIILYGRLYEEERFQYVSFIFGERVFIIELTTGIPDIQERASETMGALIRKFGGVPKVSSFIKVQQNIAHIVAEIDLQSKTVAPCELVPDDITILNLNEITELIMASHYLVNQPRTRIEQIYADTLFHKQPFLEGMYVNNKQVFGCVDLSEKDNGASLQPPIILVFCDTITQSNFLWNDKPFPVNVKQLTATDVGRAASNMPYEQLQLLPISVVSDADECGGVRYGDQILYDGPLVIVL